MLLNNRTLSICVAGGRDILDLVSETPKHTYLEFIINGNLLPYRLWETDRLYIKIKPWNLT